MVHCDQDAATAVARPQQEPSSKHLAPHKSRGGRDVRLSTAQGPLADLQSQEGRGVKVCARRHGPAAARRVTADGLPKGTLRPLAAEQQFPMCSSQQRALTQHSRVYADRANPQGSTIGGYGATHHNGPIIQNSGVAQGAEVARRGQGGGGVHLQSAGRR